ncbi:MAG: ribonucleoside triphosphate reductase [Minisyncoccia bacterium]
MVENKIAKVIKRDGTIVDFDKEKITQAIFKALTAANQGDGEKSKEITEKVISLLNRRFKEGEIPNVEEIQDIIEEVLISEGLVETAKSFILYREQRRKIREAILVSEEAVDRIDQYLEKLDWEVQENANMSFSLQGLNHYGVSYIVKKYWLNKIYPKEIREANESGDFHIHNLDTLGCYCMGWDLYDLLVKGFGGVPGKVESKPPKHFRSALGQVVNFMYTLQGEAAGAIAFSNFDTLLAPFVRYDNLNYQQVKQALQEFLFNMAIPTRVGFQSLAWEELVVIKHKEKIKFVEIGKLIDKVFEENSHRIIEQYPQSYAVENFDDYYTLSFDSEGKAVWAKVKAFIRHKVPQKSSFLKIRTNRGEAIVSPAHSLFAFEKFNGQFNPTPISANDIEIASDYRHLNEKNHFLALGKIEQEKKEERLDLVELIDEFPQLQKNVFVKINPTHTLSKIRKNILKEYQAIHPFYIDFGIRDKSIWKDWLKRKSIRYDIWRKFGDQKQNIKFRLKNSKIWYPRILKGKLLENFVKLCAWYVGEGHKGMSVSAYLSQAERKNKEEILETLKFLKSLGKSEESKGYSQKGNKVQKVYKIAAKGLLAEIVSLSGGILSFNKVIPWYIFNLFPDLQRIFIETLLKGEATEYKNHWDFSTTSKKFSLSLSLLLSQQDIRFSVYTEKVSKNNQNWRDQYIIRVFKENSKYGRKQYRVGDFEARVCLNKEEVSYEKEFEYDISVDLPQENFVGGTGCLVFHNTPFTNITLDLKPSPVFAKLPVIIGGKSQKETYGEFEEEMKIFNKALYEVYLEGDAKGRVFTFPIPTINITKDFPWDESAFDGIFEASAKYGINYFANYINSEMKPEDVRSMCCRLRLNLKELYNRGGGGLFGAGAKTGSTGVCTINMPRIGYLSKTKKEFFERLGKIMDLAKESLEIKRKALENYIEKGLYPYSRYYLSDIKKMRDQYYANHFSTIGLVGMNEALLNFLGEDIGSKKGKSFALEILDFMRERLVKYQNETGNLYNLEQTPSESTAYRLALKDKERYPDIITAGTKKVPYYTNSTQLPVNYTDDVFEALSLQDDLTCKYTGGSVFHIFLGERMQDGEGVKKLIKRVFETFKLPYITITPTFSICPVHGYLEGEHFYCPKCTIKQPCEVYTRVVGYLRPVNQFNFGKQQEYKERKTFKIKKQELIKL